MEKEILKTLDERELHRFLVSFLANNLNIYSKTIFHESSIKSAKGRNEWLHPDIVGFSLPVESWDEKVLELCGKFSLNRATIYSFEMKKSITTESLREQFFQAVSNSSWANEGYLVAVDIDTSNELLVQEMSRLSRAFGIGIIKLNLLNSEKSEILFPSQSRPSLNGETMNRLIAINNDFQVFVQSVLNSIKINSPVRDFLDEVYSKNKLNEFISQKTIAQATVFSKTENMPVQSKDKHNLSSTSSYPLSADFTGATPLGIQIKSDKLTAENWKSIYCKVCEYLIEKDIELFLSFQNTIKGKKRDYFSPMSDNLKSPYRLEGANIYIETNLNANNIVKIIDKMLTAFSISANDVKVYIKEKNC